MKTGTAAVLLCGTFLAASAHAQPAPAPGEIEALRAQVAALTARLEAVEGRVAAPAPPPVATPAPPPAATPTPTPAPQIAFHGAPQVTAPGGWSFKPRGRLQYDAGWVGRPGGIADPGLGFANELRRARIGVEGTIPGGFGYVFEVDLAEGGAEIVDAYLNYRAAPPLTITIGQHNGFQSLEELASSRFSSFVERAAFTDAFNFERRVGVSVAYSRGPLLVQAGVFTDSVEDLGEDADNAVGVDTRLVFAPRLGDVQLHLGASAHWRDNGDLPGMGVTTRYRQRPLVHFTDVRFIGTPALAVETETSYGLEAALIRGPFHATGELYRLEADTLTPGLSPAFFGGYGEIGYYLTGETRGYRGGKWDRTRVLRPVGGEGGGWGALQVNLRYDRLDLNSGPIRGGVQDALLAGLIWIPTDYVRFLVNYGRMSYTGAVLPAAAGDRDYVVDVVGARAQIDF
jgi:phosphate-selective porin OprO/OprP